MEVKTTISRGLGDRGLGTCTEVLNSNTLIQVGLFTTAGGFAEGEAVGPYTGEWLTETEVLVENG